MGEPARWLTYVDVNGKRGVLVSDEGRERQMVEREAVSAEGHEVTKFLGPWKAIKGVDESVLRRGIGGRGGQGAVPISCFFAQRRLKCPVNCRKWGRRSGAARGYYGGGASERDASQGSGAATGDGVGRGCSTDCDCGSG